MILKFLFCLLLLFSSLSEARIATFQFGLLGGTGTSSSPTDASAPSVGTFDINVGVGAVIAQKFVLGVMADYRIITQYSDILPTVGNRRGNFMSAPTPYAGFFLGKSLLTIALINSGTYDLENKTLSGRTVSFTDPTGFRVAVSISAGMKYLQPVVYYETVKFQNQNVDGASSADRTLNLTHYGLGVVCLF